MGCGGSTARAVHPVPAESARTDAMSTSETTAEIASLKAKVVTLEKQLDESLGDREPRPPARATSATLKLALSSSAALPSLANDAMEEEIERQNMLLEVLQDRLREDTLSHEKFQRESVAHVAELDKEIEDLKDRLDTEVVERQRIVKHSAAHVTELEKDIKGIQTHFEAAKTKCAELQMLLDKYPIVSADLAIEADVPATANPASVTPMAEPGVLPISTARSAGEEAANQELARLQLHISSLTLQLQQVHGNSDPFRETAPAKEDPSPALQALLDSCDDARVRARFHELADTKDGADEPRMSKVALTRALEALHVMRDDREIDALMSRVDINGDGVIDADEFCMEIQRKSQLESLLTSLPLLRALANQLGGKIDAYRKMADSQVDAHGHACVYSICEIIKQNLRAMRAVEEGRVAAGETLSAVGGKFAFAIQGGDLQDYHGGVTGRVGEPHADIAEGMRKEHLCSRDAHIPFTTSNYNLTTTPYKEYNHVIDGGVGLEKGDVRVLRPLTYYRELKSVTTAGLTSYEIIAIILYTGPMFQIYNGMLRGFGHCGEVQAGVAPVTVKERCKCAQNTYTSVIHCLVSGVKKLQQTGGRMRGWLYRGLGGGELPASFHRTGFAEWAFMSTTKSLEVAIEYSGASDGHGATVLRVEASDVDGAASVQEFSQYPREKEWLWGVLCYVQCLEGKDEMCSTPHGMVRLVTVKVNSNGQAKTVEQLTGRRKDLHLATVHHNRIDLQRAIEEWGDVPQELSEAILRQYGELEEQHRALAASAYNEDLQYRALVNQLLDAMAFARAMLEFGDSTQYLREAHREQINAAEHQMHGTAPGSVERTAAALLVCKRRGLIAHACDLDKVNDLGESPLIEAAANGELLRVQLLLEAGANVLATNRRAQGPLVDCAASGYVECLRELLRCNANVGALDEFGCTALLYAAREGHQACVRELLAAGADVGASDNDGSTALMGAANLGHEACVRELLAAGADVGASDNDGSTALMLAAMQGHEACVRELLAAGADVGASDNDGDTALMLAEQGGHEACVRELLAAGSDVDASGHEG